MILWRSALHLGLHVAVPGAWSWALYRKRWPTAWLLMLLAMLVDLDHLLAEPIFDPNRCSIGFHPLHSYPAVAAYGLLLLVPALRIVGVGLLIHMGLDAVDCIWMPRG